MILNLTQHPASPEQLEAGVVDVSGIYRDFYSQDLSEVWYEVDLLASLKELLTFEDMPTAKEMKGRALSLRTLIRRFESVNGVEINQVMIGGAPYFMSTLENVLRKEFNGRSYEPLYAFSVRQSQEEVVDGKVVKTAVFKHLGFVAPE